MEVFHQRLDQEYGASIITTTPTVPYALKHTDGSTEEIQNPSQVQPALVLSYMLSVPPTFPYQVCYFVNFFIPDCRLLCSG